jgi:hypothetical protein
MMLSCLPPSAAFELMSRKTKAQASCTGAWSRTGHLMDYPNAGWSLAPRRAAGRVSYLQGAVDAMLRHAYEQGRADAALGL